MDTLFETGLLWFLRRTRYGLMQTDLLALAGGTQAIVTHNLRDLRGGDLRLGSLRIMTPAKCLEEWK